MQNKDLIYLCRCRQLSRMGRASVAPNPPVGSILVWEDQIIGEGFHQALGEAHAEVNAISNVREADRYKLSNSSLYVSLEPCNHHGRTAPCTELILRSGIPRVVIGNRDPYRTSKGGGVEYLRSHGVTVDLHEQHQDSELTYFSTSIDSNRPRVILKYAVSRYGFIGRKDRQIRLSNPISQRRVHALRAQAQAIMVGTNTIQIDNPRLDIRKYFGTPPVIVVLDRKARLKGDEKVFQAPRVVYVTEEKIVPKRMQTATGIKPIRTKDWDISALLQRLYAEGLRSIFVEGGKQLIEAFVGSNCWDECYEIMTTSHLNQGVEAPGFEARSLLNSWLVRDDIWNHYLPVKS